MSLPRAEKFALYAFVFKKLTGHPELLALSSRVFSPPQTIFAPFDQRWEYPMVPAIGGLEKATRFSPDSGCASIPLSRFRA